MLYILTPENKKNVGDVIKTSPNITILYYWNMCGHCTALMPTWDKICKKYKNKGDCDLLNVEVSHLQHLPAKYKKGVSGFPTIIKYNKGVKVGEYNDERVFHKIDKFVKK
uniref:Thioredoxin domain-containing protein n=1 Tax=viral metagenome TaxID=1070528 RepID=A0A6C0LIL0_9ZZZZ